MLDYNNGNVMEEVKQIPVYGEYDVVVADGFHGNIALKGLEGGAKVVTTLLKEEEVIAMISNKRIMLIDENPSGNDKKTLTYCFDVLTPDNSSLVLFVTKSVYDAYKVQDRLKVAYKVYVNDKGVQFPIVSLVTSVTE